MYEFYLVLRELLFCFFSRGSGVLPGPKYILLCLNKEMDHYMRNCADHVLCCVIYTPGISNFCVNWAQLALNGSNHFRFCYSCLTIYLYVYIDPLLQQLDKRHFWSFKISPIENFDDIYSGLLTLSITLRS